MKQPAFYYPFSLLVLIAVCACTKAQTSVLNSPQYDFIVAKDGSGDFQTVQAAINAMPDLRKNPTIIYIKNGTYKEKLLLPATKQNVKFVGQHLDSVILTYDDYASKKNIFGEEIGTSGSASFFIYGDNFTAQNISFENSAGPIGQAVAVRVASDRVRFINCKFLGFQDTIYTYGYGAASRQYYKDCYIEGTTDFIFGSSTAVFDGCILFGKTGGQFFTAASTPDTSRFGYVFLKCTVKCDPNTSYYLGRPWRPYAKTVFLYCNLGSQIKPEGWHNWGKPEAESTTFYGEYKNLGVGAALLKRVSWSHQLSDEQATQYSIKNIFRGWDVEQP